MNSSVIIYSKDIRWIQRLVAKSYHFHSVFPSRLNLVKMSAAEKRAWPELVGKDADSAIKTIQQESGIQLLSISSL